MANVSHLGAGHTLSDGDRVSVDGGPYGYCPDVVPCQSLGQFEGQDLGSVVGISGRQHFQQRLFIIRRIVAVLHRLLEGRDVDSRSLAVPPKHATNDVT